MRVKTLVATLLISCFSGALCNIVISQGVIAQTPEEIKAMSSVGVPIVLPTYLPSGFRRTYFATDLPLDKYSYNTTYQGSNNCKITIRGALGSIYGYGPFVGRWIVNTSFFGKIFLDEWSSNQNSNYLFSIVSGNNKVYEFKFYCTNSVFSPQQASQILKSMQAIQ
ncbi:MAG: hypothetical protein O4753_03215 [Trichodesmium sp. St7_bin2_1]|nr:hypothetical protein [Trichodesmium sp. St7_bin2_1]